METPQRVLNEFKSPRQFSPVTVQESPVAKTSQRGNLTGNPRVLRDYAADTYNLIQKWNAHQILGGRIVKNIVALKTSEVNSADANAIEVYPSGLQEHCDQLGEVCIVMKEVSGSLKLIHKQVKALIKLESQKQLHKNEQWLKSHEHQESNQPPESVPNLEVPMFISWKPEKFGEVHQQISQAYEDELEVKLNVKENIAHTRSKPALMIHASAWVQQAYITPDVDLAVESLLQETGHR